MKQRQYRTIVLLLSLFFLCGRVSAQVDSKPMPAGVGISADSVSRPQNQSSLPTIQLPEYVILGSAAIEIASVEKNDPLSELVLPLSHLALRREEKYRIEEEGGRTFPLFTETISRQGFFDVRGGTYNTYNLLLKHAQQLSNVAFYAGGNYHITHGFAPFTHSSGGGVAAAVSSRISVENMFTEAMVGSAVAFSTKKFNFYGSVNPNRSREVELLSFNASIANSQEMPESQLSVGVRSFAVNDTGNTHSENLFALGYKMPVMLPSFRFFTEALLTVASGGLSALTLKARSEYYTWQMVDIQGALEFSWFRGMAGQTITRISPQIEIASELIEHHRFFLSYFPSVRFNSLERMYQICPYISSQSTIKHENRTDAGAVGVTSVWTEDITTKASVVVQSIKDYSLLTEYRPGEWQTAFGGKVTMLSFLGEMVAKFTVNDYFSTQVKVNSAKIAMSSEKVPYVPDIEVGAMLYHGFGRNARLILSMWYNGKRQIERGSTATLPGYTVLNVWGEYDILSYARVYVDVQNITDSRYSQWHRYQAIPLTISAGVRIQW